MKKITLLFLLVATTMSAQQVLVNSDFSTFTNGALVGQGGWVQYNTATTNPLTVNNGVLSWAGAAVADDQDAMYPFSAVVGQPTSGVTTINMDVVMSVSSAGVSGPSYFLALNGLTTTTSTGNYQNARIAAIQNADGYVLGGRVNGQTGYPFVYGTTKLTFGTFYAVRSVLKMVAGNANDTLKLYVGSDFNNLLLYSTCAYTSGTVGDPTVGAALISQYGSVTVIESGASIKSVKVTNLGTISGFSTPSIDQLSVKVIGGRLSVENASTTTVEIYNATGARAQFGTLENGSIQLNSLAKGLYVVRVGNATAKIML